ncbi:MAG: type II secretion system protein GspG [Patescibacteria group bacterium]|nr:MAG: type II secretion system protein GspG [Patescibacteria group bacterium]
MLKLIRKKSSEYGFSLIEMMLVILLLGVLASLITNTFVNSLKKSRDARRKGDIKEIKNAIEMFYADNNFYPTPTYVAFGSSLEYNGKVYMKKLPQDPKSNCSYKYVLNANNGEFYILSTIENDQDEFPGVSQGGYYEIGSSSNKYYCTRSGSNQPCLCRFYDGSPNAVLTPAP